MIENDDSSSSLYGSDGRYWQLNGMVGLNGPGLYRSVEWEEEMGWDGAMTMRQSSHPHVGVGVSTVVL